ncbi:MAG: MPMin1 gp15 [Microbacterium sp.]|nr:MPMin1 gp15 [Microbacterium sp.]
MTDQQTVEPTEEEVAKTLAEYERIAQETGEWDGREATEFSNDGVTFSPVWLKTPEHPHPLVARSTVHRKGVAIPTTSYVLWDEAVPADAAWSALWLARPTTLFGAFTARTAIRSAFRAAIGTRREPDDHPTGAPEAPAPQRDWMADLEAAQTSADLTQVWAEARAVRARTPEGEVLFDRKLAELEEREADAWGPAATPAPARPAPRDRMPAKSTATKRSRKGRRR